MAGPFDKYRGAVGQRRDVATGGQIQAGPRIELFEKKFERVFTGEALSEPWRVESKKRVIDLEKPQISVLVLFFLVSRSFCLARY